MDRLRLAMRIEETFMERLGLEIVTAGQIEFSSVEKRGDHD